MTNTIEELKNSAKFHDYFWNGLFAALYEDIREDNPVGDLSFGYNDGYQIFASATTIKNYLSCKTKMDFNCFLEYCQGIQFDIEKKSFMELIPYVNRALAYLEEQDFSGKVSRSKFRRQKVFSQADNLMDEDYLWKQQLAEDEKENAEIRKAFSGLSPKEMALLCRAADGYPFTCECDDTFMDCYCRLNEKGRSIFREALEAEHKKWNVTYRDEFCDFCREMAADDVPALQDITLETLCEKLAGADFYFQPEDAQNLKKYCCTEPEVWQTLETFHKIIFSYPEGNIEGMSFSEKESLLIFLYWLVSIPSLCK